MDVYETAEDILNEKGSNILATSPDSTLAVAINLMTEQNIGAILIKDGDQYVGIWTERDLLKTLVAKNLDPQTARIGDHMQTNLISAEHSESIYSLIDKFLGLRLRHLMVQRDGRYIGLLSVGDVMRAALQHQTDELQRMRDIVSLKYYDRWCYNKKK